MHRTSPQRTATALRAAVAIVGVSGVALVTTAGAPANVTHPKASPLTFLAETTSLATPDPSFPKAGDTIVVTQKNVSNGHRIGEDRTACMVTDSSGSLQCTTTVGLPGGFLEVAYPENLSSKNITAPITGGAGRYATARGYFALHQLNPTKYQVTLHLQ
jgi:hypothetical protein